MNGQLGGVIIHFIRLGGGAIRNKYPRGPIKGGENIFKTKSNKIAFIK